MVARSAQGKKRGEVLLQGLAPEVRAVLELVGQAAAAAGMEAYLVGGPVRDALLGRPLQDLDVVVEGDALSLARTIAQKLKCPWVEYPQFGTATIEVGEGQSVDLASARRETYAHSGALPAVEPAPLTEDLQRRDFTINAMALRLNPAHWGELVDPLGGQRDLQARLLRALHRRSFLDDPTRILRAAAYSERLKFRLEPRTQAWLEEALAARALERVRGPRAGEQLRRALLTAPAGPYLLRVASWGALEQLGLPPQPRWPEALAHLEQAQERLGASNEEVAQAAFALAAGVLASRAARHLGLPKEYAQVGAELQRAVEQRLLARLARVTRLSTADALLGELRRGSVVALWALAGERARRTIEAWLAAASAAVLGVRGRDLLAAGVGAGPAVRVGLAAARRAALDGRATTPAHQLEIATRAARRWLARQGK
jgi:tRNA nucleotidyltransferase (CCA-adding enzyme)